MKTIGLLGGMSWQSTVLYYEQINQQVSEALGALHSAKIVLHSVDFSEIEKLQHQGDWQACADILSTAARGLEKAGADIMLICTNTMHMVANEVQQSIAIPLLHIADATGKQLQRGGIKKTALLGTAFTMEKDFYKDRICSQFGIEVIVPNKQERLIVHDIIYNELCLGNIQEESRKHYATIIDNLKQQGAESVILGCTEITLLISQKDSSLPVFDTTAIHAEEAVRRALA